MAARTARLPALLIAGALALPGAAAAQIAVPGAGPQQPRTMVTVPLQDLPGTGVADRARSLWGDFVGLFGFGSSSSHFARQHRALQRGALGQQQDEFTWLMDIAGYKLKEIESSVGLIPTLSLTFGQARELTEADRDYVERMLERHARRNPGPIAAIQRTIVRGVLDASEIGGFGVEKVEVDLFPLPKVKFALSPVDAPLGLEASRIMRSIERLNQRVQQMAPARSGLELPSPGAAPMPGLRPVSLEQ
jgi:hypothetical protein